MTFTEHENYARDLLSSLSTEYSRTETLDFVLNPTQSRNAAKAMTAILCRRLSESSNRHPTHKGSKTYEWKDGIINNRNIADRDYLWTNIRRNVADELHDNAASKALAYLMAFSNPSDDTIQVWAIPEPVIFESLSRLPLKEGGGEYTIQIRRKTQRIEHDAESPDLTQYFTEFPLTPEELQLLQEAREVDAAVRRVRRAEHGDEIAEESDDDFLDETPLAHDLEEPATTRIQFTVSRIVRDTALATRVKRLHDYECQICGHTIILPDGSRYAEGHHLQPLGAPHDGPDILGNIICVCPNHHAECDLASIRLVRDQLRRAKGHEVSPKFIDYHNQIHETVRKQGRTI